MSKYHCPICNSKINNNKSSIKRHERTTKHINADTTTYLPSDIQNIILDYCNPIKLTSNLLSASLIIQASVKMQYRYNKIMNRYADSLVDEIIAISDEHKYIPRKLGYVDYDLKYINQRCLSLLPHSLENFKSTMPRENIETWFTPKQRKLIAKYTKYLQENI